jgi:CDP-diacylglycerol--serine O-phosphatidyltransferase
MKDSAEASSEHFLSPLLSPKSKELLDQYSPMVTMIVDWANLTTLIGLCFSISAIYAVISKQYSLGMCFICCSIVCDWLDGNFARKTRERPEIYSQFGVQLDSLVDIVSFGVFPSTSLLRFVGY